MILHQLKKLMPLFLLLNCFFTPSLVRAQIRSTVSNILVTEWDGKGLRDYYKKQFKKSAEDQRTLAESFILDYCFIEKFTAMLEKTDNQYTGFRFIFGTDLIDGNKQKLFVIPTKKVDSDDYMNQWDLPDDNKNCDFKNFSLIGADAAKKQVEKFSTYHRGDSTSNPRDNLSKAIRFNIEVMQFIRDTIKNSPEKRLVDVKIINACYKKFFNNDASRANREIGQKHPIQSTILIVFRWRNPATNQVEDYWKFNQTLQKLFVKEKGANFFNVLNHGSLCPNKCN